MFSGTQGTVSIVAGIIASACLVSSYSAWPLPVSMALRRSSSVDSVHRALLTEGHGSKATGGSLANPWARGTAAPRPAYWLPSELGVHHYTIAGALSAPLSRAIVFCSGIVEGDPCGTDQDDCVAHQTRLLCRRTVPEPASSLTVLACFRGQPTDGVRKLLVICAITCHLKLGLHPAHRAGASKQRVRCQSKTGCERAGQIP